MSLLSRLANVFHPDRLSRDIDEELASHLEAATARGRDPLEARRALGSPLRHREASHDLRVIPWLDSLRADTVFAWRQLKKRKATSLAAILSLGLAIGACTAAFRIADALLFRPLPIAHPERLYVLSYQGKGKGNDGIGEASYSFSYPLFRQMRAAAMDQAELIATSRTVRVDVTFGADRDMEKANQQYVSGETFSSFGIHPALGRLFTAEDDAAPNAAPFAVLSCDYWTLRFGRDPNVIGRPVRFGNRLATIIGVAPEGFTGTEPGMMTDLFRPTAMNPDFANPDSNWVRILIHLKPGVAPGPVWSKLSAVFRSFREDQIKRLRDVTRQDRSNYVAQRLLMDAAPSGASNMQATYRLPLTALGILVALVLLIACANVANLMTAQSAARAREMALRVSIGAGRARLIQLVCVEGSLLAIAAAFAGALFAWWAGPFVVSRINSSDNPARLLLPIDLRVASFALALTLAVTLLFALAPALRASRIRPASALKDGAAARHRSMHSLIAVQVAFCVLVLFVAGLFVATSQRLTRQYPGFSTDRLLNLETVAAQNQPVSVWDEALEHLRRQPGVQAAAFSSWPLISGTEWGLHISVNGGPLNDDVAAFLEISPGWLDTMRVPLLAGRDFNDRDVYPRVALVNQAFARRYFAGQNAIGNYFGTGMDDPRVEIVGVAGDARYDDLRGPIPPTVYVPLRRLDQTRALRPQNYGTFTVRTVSPSSPAMASLLRGEVVRARPELRVSTVVSQQGLIDARTIRERLLAMLASFFAAVALLLAGVGLYGVLDYSVFQRRREIGIRLAVGARASHIIRGVTFGILAWVLAGAAAGLALGIASARYLASLLYQVKPTDASSLAIPAIALLAAAILAALPPVLRAIRVDPVQVLRSE